MKTIIDLKGYDNLNYTSLKMNYPKDIFKSLLDFNVIVRIFKPDIIHSHTYYANMFIKAYSVIYKNRIIKICNEHGTYRKGSNKIYSIPLKMTKKIPDYFVNVSHSSLMSYSNNDLCDKRRCGVLYNGIALNKFKSNEELTVKLRDQYSLQKSKILFGYVGRLSKEKDVINLLQAVRVLKNLTKKDFNLIVVGDGPEKQNLENFVNSHMMNDIVIFAGEKNNVIPYLSMIDILVLPSKTEGLPTILLEAMAMGCMIVSTDCGGVEEILSGTKSYIAPIENPYELAKKMNEVLNLDSKTRSIYSKEYRNKIISTFSIEHTVNEIYALYSRILYKDYL